MREDKKVTQKRYRLKHAEKLKADRKVWSLNNPERKKESKKQWMLKNHQKIVDENKRWKEKHLGYMKQYKQSPQGKEADRRNKAKRRRLGFVPLNKKLPGTEGHHINREEVVYIPKKLHRSIWHSLSLNINMDKINLVTFDYLWGLL